MGARTKSIYTRMLADLERYRFDCAANPQDAQTAKKNAEIRYQEAQKLTKDFDSSDRECLQIALNFAAFQAVCLDNLRAAFITCRQVGPLLLPPLHQIIALSFQAREDAKLGGHAYDPIIAGLIEKLEANLKNWKEHLGIPDDSFSDDDP